MKNIGQAYRGTEFLDDKKGKIMSLLKEFRKDSYWIQLMVGISMFSQGLYQAAKSIGKIPNGTIMLFGVSICFGILFAIYKKISLVTTITMTTLMGLGLVLSIVELYKYKLFGLIRLLFTALLLASTVCILIQGPKALVKK